VRAAVSATSKPLEERFVHKHVDKTSDNTGQRLLLLSSRESDRQMTGEIAIVMMIMMTSRTCECDSFNHVKTIISPNQPISAGATAVLQAAVDTFRSFQMEFDCQVEPNGCRKTGS